MNTINIILKSVRGLSVVAIIAVLAIGFVMPVSITQALVFNPVLLAIFMGCFVYSGYKLAEQSGELDVVIRA
jgi:hypothetical protein